jgi:hypothetical protein
LSQEILSCQLDQNPARCYQATYQSYRFVYCEPRLRQSYLAARHRLAGQDLDHP